MVRALHDVAVELFTAESEALPAGEGEDLAQIPMPAVTGRPATARVARPRTQVVTSTGAGTARKDADGEGVWAIRELQGAVRVEAVAPKTLVTPEALPRAPEVAPRSGGAAPSVPRAELEPAAIPAASSDLGRSPTRAAAARTEEVEAPEPSTVSAVPVHGVGVAEPRGRRPYAWATAAVVAIGALGAVFAGALGDDAPRAASEPVAFDGREVTRAAPSASARAAAPVPEAETPAAAAEVTVAVEPEGAVAPELPETPPEAAGGATPGAAADLVPTAEGGEPEAAVVPELQETPPEAAVIAEPEAAVDLAPAAAIVESGAAGGSADAADAAVPAPDEDAVSGPAEAETPAEAPAKPAISAAQARVIKARQEAYKREFERRRAERLRAAAEKAAQNREIARQRQRDYEAARERQRRHAP